MSQNYEITEADELAQGGAKTKARANIAAIRLLQELEADQRQAAPDEQAVLVKFAGWGTMADLFTGKPEWADLQAELRSLVTDQEYAAARSAILNAHYWPHREAALSRGYDSCPGLQRHAVSRQPF
jgi:hypothetical protein